MKYQVFRLGLMIFLALMLGSCFGPPKYKKAVFNRDAEQVREEIRKLGSFEDARVGWSARTFDDELTQVLKIQLLNGEVTGGDSVEYQIGKQAMTILVNAIDNKTDYDEFTVVFVNRSKTGPVTMSSERPYTYKLPELLDQP